MGLLRTAIQARPLTKLAGRTWRVLGGVNASAKDLASLARMADEMGQGHVVVERSRTDFPNLLADCELSVSQGGYNTMMEIVQARARAVVVPFAASAETEQTLRGRRFAERGLIELVEEHALTPESLAAAIDRAAKRPRPDKEAIALDGAPRTAALISEWTSGLKW